MRSRFRRRPTPYGLMLREVQKVKRYYGLLDKQFRRFFENASRMKGNTGEMLLVLLERRLDNVVTRMGFATSRAYARQLITHGHVYVDGKRCRKPAYITSPGETMTVSTKESIAKAVKENVQAVGGEREVPAWLEVNKESLTGKVLTKPKREDVSIPVQEHLVVEFCSR
jgi:small subunit ribosomal protein S4